MKEGERNVMDVRVYIRITEKMVYPILTRTNQEEGERGRRGTDRGTALWHVYICNATPTMITWKGRGIG